MTGLLADDEYDSRASIHHYHVSEANRLTQQAIDYLQGFTVDNPQVKEAFALCIARLEQVIVNSNEFYKGIKLTPGNRYTQTEDEYNHKDPSFWYVYVIGSAEGPQRPARSNGAWKVVDIKSLTHEVQSKRLSNIQKY